MRINERDSALKYASLGLRIPEKNRTPYVYYVLAQSHLNKKDYQKSLDYIHIGLPLIKASKREKNIAQVYACAANDYFGLNNIDSSIYYSKQHRIMHFKGRKLPILHCSKNKSVFIKDRSKIEDLLL